MWLWGLDVVSGSYRGGSIIKFFNIYIKLKRLIGNLRVVFTLIFKGLRRSCAIGGEVFVLGR